MPPFIPVEEFFPKVVDVRESSHFWFFILLHSNIFCIWNGHYLSLFLLLLFPPFPASKQNKTFCFYSLDQLLWKCVCLNHRTWFLPLPPLFLRLRSLIYPVVTVRRQNVSLTAPPLDHHATLPACLTCLYFLKEQPGNSGAIVYLFYPKSNHLCSRIKAHPFLLLGSLSLGNRNSFRIWQRFHL